MLAQGIVWTGRIRYAPYRFAYHLSYKRTYTLSISNCQLHINCVHDTFCIWRIRMSQCAEEMHHIPRAKQDPSTLSQATALSGSWKWKELGDLSLVFPPLAWDFLISISTTMGRLLWSHASPVKGGLGTLYFYLTFHVPTEGKNRAQVGARYIIKSYWHLWSTPKSKPDVNLIWTLFKLHHASDLVHV